MARVIEFEATDFKKLKVVKLQRTGPVTVIGGDNGEGKSSVLDVIDGLFGADYSPDDPIRTGATRAETTIKLAEPDLIAEVTWTAKGGRTLKVRNKPGGQPLPEPQSLLGKIVGKRFDPGEFVLLKPAERAAMLSKVTGLDFTAENTERKTVFDARTGHNRDLDSAKARLAKAPTAPDGTPDAEVSVAEVLDEIEKATKLKADYDAKVARVNSLRAEYEACAKRLEELKKAGQEAKKAVPANFKAPDLDGLRAKAKTVEATNANVRAKKERSALEAEVAKLVETVQSDTARIEAIDKAKAKKLAEAKMPVPGLGFDATGDVTFEGHPFDQAGTANQMRIAAALWIALNPEFKTLRLYNASLFDEKSLTALKEVAAAANVDLMIERVGKEGATVVIEDGQICGTEPAQPAEQAKAPEEKKPARKKKEAPPVAEEPAAPPPAKPSATEAAAPSGDVDPFSPAQEETSVGESAEDGDGEDKAPF